ncbi:hypothetical protein [Flavobacterium turcicum]|uniref:Phosphatidate cytidylyltransferase n=1 Tax=Flavobacterium turcicum TaxID=2764718 RepID=A0ABR7JHV7_9FLAO|nr:hypothetical protein [Flavobacterium turcicum]MBC5864074.1 hypothetical protein [Flavobacterium turcicum]NHL02840.1 hypothetical protein [Flavobacterium turcicum]
MFQQISRVFLLVLVLLTVSSCSLIEGIFKAGVGVGIFIVVAILAILAFIISRILGRK